MSYNASKSDPMSSTESNNVVESDVDSGPNLDVILINLIQNQIIILLLHLMSSILLIIQKNHIHNRLVMRMRLLTN